ALLFSTAFGTLLSALVVAAEYARQIGQAAKSQVEGAPPASPEGAEPGAAGAPPAADMALRAAPEEAAKAGSDPTLLYIAIALLVTVAVLSAIAWWYWRQTRARERADAVAAPKA
ncbi:MAG TPA: hypothetical protein VGR28_15560, partial [Candidatus Thermoplasmatota archaeon]|nr:hypothetical protein [Candidatus Thermoplasmatota archaeon]